MFSFVQLKGFLNQIKLGIASYYKALFFIKKHGYFWYILIPFILMFWVYKLGFYLQNLTHKPNIYSVNEMVWFLIYVLIEVTIALMLMRFTKYLVVALLSPLLAHITEKTERIITKTKTPYSLEQYIIDIKRALVILIRNLMWYYSYFVIIQIVCYIFWEEPKNSPLQWLNILICAYYYGFSFLDYVIERRKKTVSESILFVRKNAGLAITIGLGYSALLWVPVDLDVFFNYTLTFAQTKEAIIQLFWWLLASTAPILSCVCASLAMQQIDPIQTNSTNA